MSIVLVIFTFFTGFLFAKPKETPRRIVSLNLASDEVLLDLMQRCQHLERIAALSYLVDDGQYSNVVEDAKKIPGRIGIDPEGILKANPDLVVIAPFNRAELKKFLNKQKLPFVVLSAGESFQDILSNISKLGEATGCIEEAAQMKKDFADRLAAIQKPKKKKKVIAFLTPGTTIGTRTTFQDIIEAVGAENIAATMGLAYWPKVSIESVMKQDIDFVILFSQEDRKAIHTIPGWRDLKAVKNNKIIEISSRRTNSLSIHVLDDVPDLVKSLSRN